MRSIDWQHRTPIFVVIGLMSTVALYACEELPTRDQAIDALEGEHVCCESFAEIEYSPFPDDSAGYIDIDADSPVFDFATGKSHFAAYELPRQAVPYRNMA